MISIYLSVEPLALSSMRDTLDSLLANSTSAQSIVVIGTAENGAEIRRIAGGAASSAIAVEFAFSDEVDHLSLALGMAAKSGDMTGALFVKSGVTVPYAWDARLERIAQHNPKIGTVSPLCDSFAMFALLGDEERAKIVPTDTQYVDSLTFSLSARTYIEVPCFLEDCFYITAEALKLAATKASKGNTGDVPLCWELGQLLSAHGLLNVLGDCLYVYSVNRPEVVRSGYLLEQQLVQSTIKAARFSRLGQDVQKLFESNISFKSLPGLDSSPVQLHVQHSWGGGLDRWVKNYCAADKSRVNLVLKSSGKPGAFGARLMLFSDANDTTPLQTWEFALPIRATAVSHLEYQNAIEEIVRRYAVDAILVSSLIGHSLDILNTSKPTILIGHDYYPYCPAINITFDSVCTSCEYPRLKKCFNQNNYNRNFRNVGADEWAILREQYLSKIQSRHLKLVIPSLSVKDNLTRLEPRYKNVEFVLIPHGTSPMRKVADPDSTHQASNNKLSVLILGSLAPHKGLGLLKEIISELTSFADISLVGCGHEGAFFENKGLNRIIHSYHPDELPKIILDLGPDIALLLSMVPETFSYTLSELTELNVPVVATRLGSFIERIEDGKTGFLVAPSAEDVIRKIKALDTDRAKIKLVKENLMRVQCKSVPEMVSDYHHQLPLENSQVAHFSIEKHAVSLSFLVTEQRQQVLFQNERDLLQNKRDMAQILSSRSWRMTKPLRWVSAWFDRLSGRTR